MSKQIINKNLEAILYDWHNSFALKRQNADIDYFTTQIRTYHPHKVLIVGAGTGRIAIPLNKVIKVVALDKDEHRIELLKKKDMFIETLIADIVKYKSKSGIDLVISPYSTLQNINKRLLNKVFINIYNLLEPNGIFLFDLSENFNLKGNEDWHTILNEVCTELKQRVTELNKIERKADFLIIYREYIVEAMKKTILKTKEKWYYYDPNFFESLIRNSGFNIKKIDRGYLDRSSKHRYIYHCVK